MAKIKANLSAITSEILKGIEEGIHKMECPPFIPTGALEPVIKAVGNGEFRIVNLQCANKLGKTTMVANILKNIFWEPDLEYFDYPAYHEWMFKDDSGNEIKRARIICTAANAAEGGPIDTEIRKWWSEGRYTRWKASKNYYSQYKTDTGWEFDVMTYDQEAKEFEGPLISLHWCDEPIPARLMGAIMSRYQKGGILLMSQSPVNAGPMLDIVSDLKERGTKTIEINASIYDNAIEDGIPNSKNTKRGLMTAEEIKDYVNSIPPDERDARIYGKSVGKSGKVYPMFDFTEHQRGYRLSDPSTKLWNGYCIMDPHDKYYPFIQWWAVLPPNEINKIKYVCYNEYPTFETFNGYYDEHRKDTICNLTPESIAKIIKIMDGTQFGIQIIKRGIDPRFARNSESNYSKNVEGLVLDYQKYDIDFELPDQKLMSIARDRIRNLLKYDKQMSTNIYNEPNIYIMPHCVNTIRALDRHYWEDGKDKEAEEYKDPCDCARMFFALESGKGWTQPRLTDAKKKHPQIINNPFGGDLKTVLKECSLG